MSSEHHPQLSASTSCQKGNNENESFWKQPSGSSIIKLPGRVMKQNSLQEKAEKAMRSNGGSKPGTPTKGLSSNSLPLQMHQHHQQQQQHFSSQSTGHPSSHPQSGHSTGQHPSHPSGHPPGHPSGQQSGHRIQQLTLPLSRSLDQSEIKRLSLQQQYKVQQFKGEIKL